MAESFRDCVGSARDTIIENAEYNKDFLAGMSRERVEGWLQEQIHEAVDGAVPIYNWDIMEVAKDSAVWSQDTSDYGTSRDLIHAAQLSIYMAIEEEINEDGSILDAIMDMIEEDEEADDGNIQ